MEMKDIFDKLQAVADRYDELNELISDPAVIADSQRFMKLSKEEGSLRETVEKYDEYKKVTQTISDDEEMLREIDDPDLTAMTKDELSDAKEKQAKLEKELEVLLIPRTRMMIRTSSWKSAGPLVVMRPVSLPLTFTTCTSTMLNGRAGRLKWLIRTKPKSAASRKSP